MGFSNELLFGQFSFYSLFDWQHGGDVINLTRLLYDAGGITELDLKWAGRANAVLPGTMDTPAHRAAYADAGSPRISVAAAETRWGPPLS